MGMGSLVNKFNMDAELLVRPFCMGSLTQCRSSFAGWSVHSFRQLYCELYAQTVTPDLNDHWTSKLHKQERNFFIQQLQNLAMLKKLRITFLSGDVHCAAVGVLKTLSRGGRDVDPKLDYRYMLNVVSSAIVNTP